MFSVRYEKIKFLVIALKNAVEVYAWAPKPYHKFMAFKVGNVPVSSVYSRTVGVSAINTTVKHVLCFSTNSSNCWLFMLHSFSWILHLSTNFGSCPKTLQIQSQICIWSAVTTPLGQFGAWCFWFFKTTWDVMKLTALKVLLIDRRDFSSLPDAKETRYGEMKMYLFSNIMGIKNTISDILHSKWYSCWISRQ